MERVDEKWGHLSSFHASFWVNVLKLSKKVHFLQLCAELSKKSKSVKAICIYASESSHYTLTENCMVHRRLKHRLWNISD